MDDDGDCDKPGASNAVEGEDEDVLGVVSVVNLTHHKVGFMELWQVQLLLDCLSIFSLY